MVLHNQAPEESLVEIKYETALENTFGPKKPVQTFGNFFSLPYVSRKDFLDSLRRCVGDKSEWPLQSVFNEAEKGSVSSGNAAPVKKRKQHASQRQSGKNMAEGGSSDDEGRWQAYIFGKAPPIYKNGEVDVAIAQTFLESSIRSALGRVPNPLAAAEDDDSSKKGDLVASVFTNLISAVHVLLGNRYIVTGAALLYFAKDSVRSQPWHVDYVPAGHPEDINPRFCWDEKNHCLKHKEMTRETEKKGKEGGKKGKHIELTHPLLFVFSFSDEYFLEYLPGIAVHAKFIGIEFDLFEVASKKPPKELLPFGSMAVFAADSIHRGPAKEKTEDPYVFRLHLYANHKSEIRDHNNETFKIVKQ
jgi:hypothetical protein